MKVIFRSVAVFLGFIATTTLQAQDKKDHSYSVHNYKQPNKAAEMKRIADARPVVYFEEIKTDAGQPESNLTADASGNYKALNPENGRIKAFRKTEVPYFISFATPAVLNYKQQFRATEKSEMKSKRPAEKKDLVI